jgi:hypothetical protein
MLRGELFQSQVSLQRTSQGSMWFYLKNLLTFATKVPSHKRGLIIIRGHNYHLLGNHPATAPLAMAVID